MGQEIPYQTFTSEDFYQFDVRLTQETRLLERMFAGDAFKNAHPVGGFELEAWLVDEQARPAAANVTFLQRLNNPEVVPELSLFNIEINVPPLILQEQALDHFARHLQFNWQACRDTARTMGMDLMCVGIHPALRDSQLTLENMSQSERYRVLNEQVLSLRNARPITLDLQGNTALRTVHRDVMLEAATTSFQVHLQIPQSLAVATYNAAQLVSAPLVAVSANSPYLFGADLWDESRIPLFEQAVDLGEMGGQRVCFGDDYLQASLLECFTDNLRRYPPLIPSHLDEPAETLPHLRLHNGTIWRWNRPIIGFDELGQAHLRVENRVLPSGPTVADMIANAAFYWGLTWELANNNRFWQQALPFVRVRDNFYAAARHGFNCRLHWFDGRQHDCTTLILDTLLPLAEKGLTDLGLAAGDISVYLGIIEARTRTRQNGASWQRAWVRHYGPDMEALSRAYLAQQWSGRPVHQWEL